MVAVLLEALDQHVSGRLDSIERQIVNLGNRMEQGCESSAASAQEEALQPKTPSRESGLGRSRPWKKPVDSDGHVRECLFQLSQAETTLAGVRAVLTRAVNQPGYVNQQDITLQPAACAAVPSSKLPDKAVSLAVEAVPETKRTDTTITVESTTIGCSQVILEATIDTNGNSEWEKKDDGLLLEEKDAGDCLLKSESKMAIEEKEAILEEVEEHAARHNLSETAVRDVFKCFNSANTTADGLLTLDQLEVLLIGMCDGAIEKNQIIAIMDKFDENQDGMLHFEEFLAAYSNTPLMKVAHIGHTVKNHSTETLDALREARMRLQPEEWVEMMGCSMLSLKRYVGEEILEANSCLAMPLVFALFVLYLSSIWLHCGIEQLHAVDKAISFDMKENANFAFGGDVPFENGRMGHKNIYDVNSFADFWSWLDLGIVPLFWADGWELSEVRQNVWTRCMSAVEAFDLYGWQQSSLPNVSTMRPQMTTGNDANPYFCDSQSTSDPFPQRPNTFYDGDDAGVYLYYHSVVGGIRLRQERGTSEGCTDSNLLPSVHKGQCVPSTSYFLKPDRQQSFDIKQELINQKGGETIYLKSRKTAGDIRKELHALEDRVWLSPETGKVEVLITLYNPHLDIFSATVIMVHINRGGHMFKLVEPISTHLTPYRHPVSYVVDCLLLLLILKILFGEGIEVYRDCRVKGLYLGLKEYFSPSNFIDWLGVIYFFALMSTWFTHVRLISDLRESLHPASIEVAGSFKNVSDRDNFYDIVDEWVTADFTIRTVMAVFPFIIGARFFKVFALQPRLGVVTATLQSSFVDIVHFFIVFVAIFLVFVTAAMIVFGQEIEDFTNFSRCTMTVFRIMVGDRDVEDMIHVSRLQAGAWYFGFTWLVNLVMLNMLLAIVMDVHTEVKGHISADAETMWSQTTEIVYRWNDIRAGRQIPLERVLECLELHCPTDHEDEAGLSVTLQVLMKIVPGIPEHQARRLLVLTHKQDEEGESGKGCSLSDTSSKVERILQETHALHLSVERLFHMQEITADMVANHFAAMRAHQHHKQQEDKLRHLPSLASV